MNNIIDSKSIAIKLKQDLKRNVNYRIEKGLRVPKIASILVGDDDGSIYYINSQKKLAKSLNFDFDKIILNYKINERELIELINNLNNDKNIDGIILQLPLPKHLNENKIVNTISPTKDIDCLTYINQGKLYCGEGDILPCTPNSVVKLLKESDVEIKGKNVVIIGRSNIVGKPVAQLLLNEDATVTICHSKTENLKEISKNADILIVAIGRPKFINEEYISEKSIVIDVGTSSVDGKITGDIDFDNVVDKVKLISKVPGGVGALTTTLLINNCYEAMIKNED